MTSAIARLCRSGKHILVAALVCFGLTWVLDSREIIPYVDDIVMLKARCSDCRGERTISRRRNREEPFRVGGVETYVSLCKSFYYKWEDRDTENGVIPTWAVAL